MTTYNVADIRHAIELRGEYRRTALRKIASVMWDNMSVVDKANLTEFVFNIQINPSHDAKFCGTSFHKMMKELHWISVAALVLTTAGREWRHSLSLYFREVTGSYDDLTPHGVGVTILIHNDWMNCFGAFGALSDPAFKFQVPEMFAAALGVTPAPSVPPVQRPHGLCIHSIEKYTSLTALYEIAIYITREFQRNDVANPWTRTFEVMKEMGMNDMFIQPITASIRALQLQKSITEDLTTSDLSMFTFGGDAIENFKDRMNNGDFDHIIHTQGTTMNTSTTMLGNIDLPINIAGAINTLLHSSVGKTIDDVNNFLTSSTEDIRKSFEAADAVAKNSLVEIAKLKKKMGTMSAASGLSSGHIIRSSGGFPAGTIKHVKANTLFTLENTADQAKLDFDVPCFDFATPHVMVPHIDTDYVFTMETLLAVLMSFVHDTSTYLVGHTATGKTTLIEQVAARLNWPTLRANMNKGLGVQDFVGAKDLSVDPVSKTTVTTFQEGILPTAMKQGWLLLIDECDAMASELGFVIIPILEKGRPLVLTEDGGRLVHPAPTFRIFAAANTAWAGDESRLYHGTGNGNFAVRDRFTKWITVAYLPKEIETKMVASKVPGLPDSLVERLVAMANEVRLSFMKGDITETCSPRALFAMGDNICRYMAIGMTEREATTHSLELVMLNKCSTADRAVIAEFAQRQL